MEPINVTQVLEKSETEKYPIIVTFQNGTLKKGHESLSVDVTDEPSSRSKRVKLTSTTGHTFSGTETNGDGLRNFLLIKKKNTNEARLVEVGTVSLKNEALLRKPDTVESESNKLASYLALQKTFGGKKQVRKLEQREKLKLDASNAEQALKDSILEMKVLTEDISVEQRIKESMDEFLPPCNRDATIVTDVYRLSSIISEDLYVLCQQHISDWLNMDSEEVTKEFSPLTRTLWKNMAAKKPDGDAAVAIFIADWLIKFHKTKTIRKKNPCYEISTSAEINEKLANMFLVPTESVKLRPMHMKDKTICYAMAAILIGNNCKLPLDELAQDISVNLKKLTVLSKAINAVPSTRKNEVTLKLPLPAPPKVRVTKSGLLLG